MSSSSSSLSSSSDDSESESTENLVLKLFPFNEKVKHLLVDHKFNPLLRINIDPDLELSALLGHLTEKWNKAVDAPLRLYRAPEATLRRNDAGWGEEHADLCAKHLYAAMGKPNDWCMYYRWTESRRVFRPAVIPPLPPMELQQAAAVVSRANAGEPCGVASLADSSAAQTPLDGRQRGTKRKFSLAANKRDVLRNIIASAIAASPAEQSFTGPAQAAAVCESATMSPHKETSGAVFLPDACNDSAAVLQVAALTERSPPRSPERPAHQLAPSSDALKTPPRTLGAAATSPINYSPFDSPGAGLNAAAAATFSGAVDSSRHRPAQQAGLSPTTPGPASQNPAPKQDQALNEFLVVPQGKVVSPKLRVKVQQASSTPAPASSRQRKSGGPAAGHFPHVLPSPATPTVPVGGQTQDNERGNGGGPPNVEHPMESLARRPTSPDGGHGSEHRRMVDSEMHQRADQPSASSFRKAIIESDEHLLGNLDSCQGPFFMALEDDHNGSEGQSHGGLVDDPPSNRRGPFGHGDGGYTGGHNRHAFHYETGSFEAPDKPAEHQVADNHGGQVVAASDDHVVDHADSQHRHHLNFFDGSNSFSVFASPPPRSRSSHSAERKRPTRSPTRLFDSLKYNGIKNDNNQRIIDESPILLTDESSRDFVF